MSEEILLGNLLNRLKLNVEVKTSEKADLQTDNKEFEKVNLQELLEEIQGDFIDTLEDKNGSINVEPLPTISGISFQLNQLFVNLISNSIKFAKEGVPPNINISNRIVGGNELDNPIASLFLQLYKI